MEYGYLVIRANDQLEVRRQEAAELDNQKLWSDLNGYYEVVSPDFFKTQNGLMCGSCAMMRDCIRISNQTKLHLLFMQDILPLLEMFLSFVKDLETI